MGQSATSVSAPTPPTLGLAGAPGSGKSTVARILASLGCVVADSDDIAHHAYNDPVIRRQLLTWWGDRVRAELTALGVAVKDGASGATWSRLQS